MKYNYLKLAEMLKNKREEKGLSIRNLGEKVGISHSEISRIENGARPHFSFITLANICKVLEIDMMNLLDDVGIWEVDMDQLFYVMFKQEDEHIFKIHARCEYEAIRIAMDFVVENELIDFSKSKKDVLMAAVKNPNDFNKNILDNFERTGKLFDSDDENNEDEIEELEDEEIQNCNEDCIYYCPNCGNCIKRD